MHYITRLFKPTQKPKIEASVFNAAAQIGALAKPSTEKEGRHLLKIGERSGIYTVNFPYCDGDFSFFSEFARQMSGVWLEARIQEGSHWDYTLSYPGYVLDDFSTLPEYWEDDELISLAKSGRPELLAKAWEIPVETIVQYVRQWGMLLVDEDTHESILKGKAYSEDRFEYGNCDQIFDFLEKLNYTQEMKWVFELRIPKRNYSPKREFIEDLSEDKPA